MCEYRARSCVYNHILMISWSVLVEDVCVLSEEIGQRYATPAKRSSQPETVGILTFVGVL